jgi:DNA polymerase I
LLRVVKTFDDALEMRAWFAGQSSIALDTETTGYDPFAPGFQVRLIQFGNKTDAWVLPFEEWRALVGELIERYDGTFLIHNASFDVKALEARGVQVPWHKIDDTMIAMRLAEPHRPSALKDSATRHVSRSASDSQKDLQKAMRTNKWDWATIPLDFPAYVFYAAMDVILTARLHATKVCQEGLASPLYRLEMDVRQVCSIMEANGMRVDIDFCVAQRDELLDEIDTLKKKADDEWGLNLTSNGDLGKWLLHAGVPLTRTTPGGSPSVSRESLEELLPIATGTPGDIIRQALRVRKIQKLASSYYDNFINLSTNGLLHPSIETIAARTGRMSIRNPALQTLPKASDPDAKQVRRSVVPRRESEVLIGCDYNQIELRCIAAFSGDPDLIGAFLTSDASGSDFFTEATRVVYSDSAIAKSDSRRDGVKTLFYASGYGAGINKMAATAGLPIIEMKAISDKVFSKYPGIKALMRACERAARENENWITTPAGRRIWIDPELGYKAMNGLVQGHAADVFKQALVDMAHAGLEQMMVVPVHDEILLSVPWEDVEDVQHVVRTCMTDHTPAVPMLAEPSPPVLTWGDAK